jgi:hypothetical protein
MCYITNNIFGGEEEAMIMERGLCEIKAEIEYHIKKLSFDGIKVVLYEWNENNLKIHTAENENAIKIAGLLQQQCAEHLDKISVSVCGNTNVIQL